MQIGVMAWSSLPFFFLFLSLQTFKRHPVFELTQHAVVQSWITSEPLYGQQIAPIIVFVSASTLTCSTLCPSPGLSICCGVSQRGQGVWWVFHSCGIWPCFGHVSLLPDLLWQTWTNREKNSRTKRSQHWLCFAVVTVTASDEETNLTEVFPAVLYSLKQTPPCHTLAMHRYCTDSCEHIVIINCLNRNSAFGHFGVLIKFLDCIMTLATFIRQTEMNSSHLTAGTPKRSHL